VDALFGEVVETRWLTPRYVRVVLGGEGLASFTPTAFADEYVNALFVPDGAPYSVPFDVDEARAGDPAHRPRGRRFTIRSWDDDARRVTIDFVAHGDVGFAGRWAARARPGHRLQLVGPTGAYAPDPSADWHLLVGDESALPAIARALESLPPGRRAVAVLVVDDAGCELPLESPGELTVRWVHRHAAPEDPDSLLRAVEELDFPPGRVDVFAHGEAYEVRTVRRHLLGERGVPRKPASISPYWRRGQTDEAWREVKRSWLAECEQDV
jgi:NADPH-dependent ferric siderophore reductase